jgi:hypothetical protein
MPKSSAANKKITADQLVIHICILWVKCRPSVTQVLKMRPKEAILSLLALFHRKVLPQIKLLFLRLRTFAGFNLKRYPQACKNDSQKAQSIKKTRINPGEIHATV